MTTWADFERAEPDFAARVKSLFQVQKHMTVATVRRDGSPRISGTEITFADGEVSLGMMGRSMKALDLLHDPRVAVHSPTVDAPEDDPGAWAGDAKIAGRTSDVAGPEDEGSHRFRIDVTEVVLTKVGTPADHLSIESWTPDGGYRRRQRA